MTTKIPMDLKLSNVAELTTKVLPHVPDSHVWIKMRGLPRSWAVVFASASSEMGKLFPGIRAPKDIMADVIRVSAKIICDFILR